MHPRVLEVIRPAGQDLFDRADAGSFHAAGGERLPIRKRVGATCRSAEEGVGMFSERLGALE